MCAESRHRRGQNKKDVINKSENHQNDETTQDFPMLKLPFLLQFDSFLLRAMHKTDQPYLLMFCGSAKKKSAFQLHLLQ